MNPQPTNADFIGVGTLTELARSIAPEVALSAYIDRKAIFDKFHINVISGVEFQHIAYIMERKGHTSRRKTIGMTIQNTLGHLTERKLVTYLTWNRYFSNKQAFREVAIRDEKGNMGYPKSVDALKLALLAYSEDLYDNFWHGNHELGELVDGKEQEGADLGLYDGIFTNIANDINEQRIKPYHLDGKIQRPVDNDDQQAYDLFCKWRDEGWDNHLKNAPLVIVAMNDQTAMAIADAYSNSKRNRESVQWQSNGNYKFPMWPNIEIAYDASIGKGDRMMAYTDKNLEYGVDTMNPENKIEVEVGGYGDADTVVLQPQSAQGTRLLNPTPAHFAITDGDLTPVAMAGDYYKDTFAVSSSDTTLGTVKVNANAPDNTKEYERGTILTLTASATTKGEFVKWSNGMTAAEITVTTKGCPEAVTAIFKPKSAAPAPTPDEGAGA